MPKSSSAPNPSQLGDPVSLRAETSNTQPTPDDLGARNSAAKDKQNQPSLSELVKRNPTALGDPVSLKAETKSDEGRIPEGSSGGREPTLAERAMRNPTALGDPVSLKAEKSQSEPTENDRGTKGGRGFSKL